MFARAGKMRHRLELQQLVDASPNKTATGAADQVWTTLATVWGSLEPLSGKRLEAARQEYESVSVEARIWYRSDVSAGMRIVFESRYYLVNAIVDPENLHKQLRLLCEEGVRFG